MIRTLAITSPGMAAALTTTTIGLPGKVWLATKGYWTGEGVDLQSFDIDLVRVCDVWCGMCNGPNPEKHVMSICHLYWSKSAWLRFTCGHFPKEKIRKNCGFKGRKDMAQSQVLGCH